MIVAGLNVNTVPALTASTVIDSLGGSRATAVCARNARVPAITIANARKMLMALIRRPTGTAPAGQASKVRALFIRLEHAKNCPPSLPKTPTGRARGDSGAAIYFGSFL